MPGCATPADRHARLAPVTLGELIEKRAIELGGRRRLTYRELSARAKAGGYTLNETTINAYVKHPLDEAPRRRTMHALAVALDVSYDTIRAAVFESMAEDGDSVVQVADAPHVQAWVTLAEGRTEDERAHMVEAARLVAAVLDASRARETAAEVTRIEDAKRSRHSR